MGSAFVFLLVAIILVVFNVMQEVMDSLIFSHLHLYQPCVYVTIHIISNTFKKELTIHVVGIQVWRQSSCVHSMYSWSPQISRPLCPVKILEASSGANYDGWIRLQVTPHLAAMHLSIEHVCLARNYCSPNMWNALCEKRVFNIKFIPIFSVNNFFHLTF